MKNKKIQKPISFKPLYLGIAIMLSASSFVYAESITNLSAKNEEKELEKINKQIDAYQKILELKEKQGDNLEGQITGLQAQTESLSSQINLNQEELNSLTQDIDQLQSRINEKSVLINQQKKILSELLRTYYQDFSHSITPALLTQEETINYLNNANWNTDVSQKVSELLDSVQGLRDSLASEQKTLDEKKQSVDDLQEQLNARNEYLQSSQASKERLLGQVSAEQEKYEDQIDDLEKQKEDLEQEISDIESGKINQLVGLPKGNGQLSYPLKDFRLTQGYGKTGFSGNYTSGMHNGFDLAAPKGTTVMAAADGKVVGTGDLGAFAYGKWVTINHDNGLVTLYAHMSKISVSPGKTVKKGDKIGEVGSTGFSTGSHVHFTVYASKSYEIVNFTSAKGKKGPVGASVNPGKFLKK
ncbi:MAG: murein hydrolase activator EnvC family protein [Minisyncoccota bacterium]